jgi:hypothetical protein
MIKPIFPNSRADLLVYLVAQPDCSTGQLA